jgi:hypothetical protein
LHAILWPEEETLPNAKRKFTAAELVPGQTYTVVTAFHDYDGILHPVGERWRYVGKNFLPYEDGLTLFIESDGSPSQLRLQWRDETQGSIVDHFSDFVQET